MGTLDAPSGRKAPAEEPFILAAMLSLLLSTLWIALHPDLLLQFFYSAEMLALTHLVTLGFITSLMMGVLLRLAPMALGVTPRSRRAAQVQCALFLVGASGMIIHFALGSWIGLAWATVLVLAAALIQCWNFAGVFARARAGHAPALYVAAALVHLVLAAFLGMSFGMLRAHGVGASWLSAPLLDRLAAHLHLALAGWVTTMILGLQLLLLPPVRGPRRAPIVRFLLLQGGLLLLVLCLLTGLPGRALGALAMLVAIAAHASGALRAWSRHREDLWEIVALGLLLLLALTGVLLACGVPDAASELRLRVEFAYGFTALFGWVVLTIGSTAFKLFPRWVWEERFAAARSRGPVPEVSALFSARLRHASGALVATGVLAVAAGMLAENELLVAVSVWILFAGVLAFVVNFARTARWALLGSAWTPDRDGAGPPAPPR